MASCGRCQFFLFIVGTAMALSFKKRVKYDGTKKTFWNATTRAARLFVLGVLLQVQQRSNPDNHTQARAHIQYTHYNYTVLDYVTPTFLCRQTETAEARSAGAVSVCRQAAGRSPIPVPVSGHMYNIICRNPAEFGFALHRTTEPL